jgi:hypothetical protein
MAHRDADVAWIQESTAPGLSITSAIPPVFAAYATIVVPDTNEGRFEHGRLVLRLLSEQSGDQPWWLGYLDTGSDDPVFPDAPRPPSIWGETTARPVAKRRAGAPCSHTRRR